MPALTDPAYPVARAVARRVQARFTRHLASARAAGHGGPLAAEPDADTIEAMIDGAFWASLRREEGLTPKISLAYVSPDDAGQPLRFSERLPMRPAPLARLAPAVERPGIHLGVWQDAGELKVWGTTRALPAYCFVVEVVGSGLLVIKHRSEAFGKFVNVAVLEGDQIKIVDEGFSTTPDCPRPIKSLLGFDPPRGRTGTVDVMVLLAASMRAHHRGGALLVVPRGTATWRESIVEPLLYAAAPPFSDLAELVQQESDSSDSHEWQEDLRRAVDAIAGFTAVDGATLISDDYEVFAFGAKITRRRGRPPVDRVVVTEPIEGSERTVLAPTQLGGTRHLSAAQFVHDQRHAIALVASQDGRFTIFKWSTHDDMVHAHRVEALLL